MREPAAELHVCQICRRPLDEWDEVVEGEIVAVRFRHAYVLPGTPEHEAEPVAASLVDEIVAVCDFCAAPTPTWRYPAASFDTGVSTAGEEFESVTDWAACNECHRLIEAGEWRQLANRGVDSAVRDRPVDVRRQVRQMIMGVHQKFQAARQGPPERLY